MRERECVCVSVCMGVCVSECVCVQLKFGLNEDPFVLAIYLLSVLALHKNYYHGSQSLSVLASLLLTHTPIQLLHACTHTHWNTISTSSLKKVSNV